MISALELDVETIISVYKGTVLFVFFFSLPNLFFFITMSCSAVTRRYKDAADCCSGSTGRNLLTGGSVLLLLEGNSL